MCLECAGACLHVCTAPGTMGPEPCLWPLSTAAPPVMIPCVLIRVRMFVYMFIHLYLLCLFGSLFRCVCMCGFAHVVVWGGSHIQVDGACSEACLLFWVYSLQGAAAAAGHQIDGDG